MDNQNQSTNPKTKVYQLSPVERERIIAEELFRRSIKDELDPPKEKKSKVWNALNSSFGLFCLSAIFITGLGSFLTQKREEKAETLKMNREATKYILEFDYRTAQIGNFVLQSDTMQNDKWIPSLYIWRAVTGDSAYAPIFKEFKSKPLIDLVAWFRINTFERHYNSLDKTYEALKQFPEYDGGTSTYDINKVRDILEELKQFSEEINESLIE